MITVESVLVIEEFKNFVFVIFIDHIRFRNLHLKKSLNFVKCKKKIH